MSDDAPKPKRPAKPRLHGRREVVVSAANRVQTKRGKSTERKAAIARVAELVALGWPEERIAKELGRTERWVKLARDLSKAAITTAADERLGGVVDAAVRSRQMLADATPKAAEIVFDTMHGEHHKVPQIARLRLTAALEVLNRGGVPAKSAAEVSGPDGGPVVVETLAARLHSVAQRYLAQQQANESEDE